MFANDNEPNTSLSESKKNNKRNKNSNTYDNGRFWLNCHDAHFEHPHLNFCKLSIMIFLHGLQDHIKVNNFVLANLAETLSFAYFKNPKWQSMNRNKITSLVEIHQTTSFWPTKNTRRFQINVAPHPNITLPKFHFNFLSAIVSNTLQAEEEQVPMLAPIVD